MRGKDSSLGTLVVTHPGTSGTASAGIQITSSD